MKQILADAVKHWAYVAPIVTYPSNEKEFNKLVSLLDELLEVVGGNEKHPLIGLVDVMSNLIAHYEEEYYQKSMGRGVDALKYLMNSRNLRQSDLAKIASQGVISEILNGRRKMNLRQIKQLAKFFKVSPATFIDE